MIIRIPKYPLYVHQKNVWTKVFKENAMFTLLAWHRRAGKILPSL